MEQPSLELRARVEALVGPSGAWSKVIGGYTPAARWRVPTPDGAVFAKAATTDHTAMLLRRELRAYARIEGPFMPRLIASQDHPYEPLLIIEDLSAGLWPPPWTAESFALALRAVAEAHASAADLPSYAEVHGERTPGWPAVAADPEPFLALGLVDAAWLRSCLPRLIAAETACDTSGETVAHWDLRSDNICITPSGAKLIDWAEACRSNPAIDLGGWAPSLAYEGGPPPEDVVGHAPEVAAWMSGFFAARAGLPIIPSAPRVRIVQRQQLTTALPWTIRALRLPTP